MLNALNNYSLSDIIITGGKEYHKQYQVKYMKTIVRSNSSILVSINALVLFTTTLKKII